jgi:hypothetical protein
MGVRQGENLSPFLFAMFLNDLQMFFENASLTGLETVSNCIEDKLNIYLKLFALLYADDTVLLAETYHNSSLHTVSKAFVKTTTSQNSFFFFLFKMSKIM